MSTHEIALLRHFTTRALRERFEGTLTGIGWAVLQPLAMLAVYSLMFVTVLRARLPESIELGFIPFLAVGLWPWAALTEALTRGTTAIEENAALLSKVALPRAVLVLSRVLAAFVLHGIGFALVLIALGLMGHPIKLASLALVVPLWLLLAVAAAGLALALAAVQVFVRDLAQVLAQVLAIGFFLTPIFYPREMLPAGMRPLLDANPVTAFVEAFRWSVFGVGEVTFGWLALAWFPLVALALGLIVFSRLSRHFEDFL